MKIMAGLINKKNQDVINDLIKLLPSPLIYHDVSIFVNDNYQRISKKSEIDKSHLKGDFGIGYCTRTTNGRKSINLGIEKKKELTDYFLLHGKIWDEEKQLKENIELHKSNGNFVIAMKKSSDILLSKDIIGIKQMYYGENDDFVGFSSRKDSLRCVGILPKRLLPGETILLTRESIKKMEHNKITLPKVTIHDEKMALISYNNALIESVRKRTGDEDKIGIIFSGGIDSALIAKVAAKLGKEVVCYCTGMPDSTDIKTASDSAKKLGLPIKIIKLNPLKIEKLIPKIIHVIEDWNQLQVEAALPVFCAMEKASKDGISVVLNGQGADELFAGYDWYPEILRKKGEKQLIEHMWEDLMLGYKETFERENKIAEFFNLDLRVPFCDIDVIKSAMSISIELKTRENDLMRKYIHRKVAEDLDVPLSIAWREKDAAQHASGVHDIFTLLAQSKGYVNNKKYKFKTKFEPLGSVYRYGNDYRIKVEKYGDDNVRAYLEDLALNLGVASI
jgi:asparagine synthase (glutamine-hydrolysing)